MWDIVATRLMISWHTLQTESMTWLAVTLFAYAFGLWVYKKSNYKPICTPLLIAIIVVVSVLMLTHTSYDLYYAGGRHIDFLLGPATVALAVPMYEQRLRLAKMWLPLLCGLLVGSTVAIVSAMLIAGVLNGSYATLISIAPKSVTVPIAVAVTSKLHGIPALTAALVVMTGVTGALIAKPVMMLLREKDDATRGFALGLSAHGVGTATAFQISRDAGAFSGLAMGLAGIYTAFAAPVIVPEILSIFFHE